MEITKVEAGSFLVFLLFYSSLIFYCLSKSLSSFSSINFIRSMMLLISSFSSDLVTYSFAISSRVLFISMSCRFISVAFCRILKSIGARTSVTKMFHTMYGDISTNLTPETHQEVFPYSSSEWSDIHTMLQEHQRLLHHQSVHT